MRDKIKKRKKKDETEYERKSMKVDPYLGSGTTSYLQPKKKSIKQRVYNFIRGK